MVGSISIHALREEGDRGRTAGTASRHKFLSTPSARRATEEFSEGNSSKVISIHALREEGDLDVLALLHVVGYFYPRPPRGGRRGCGGHLLRLT